MVHRKLKIAMLGHKRIPSREGGIEIVVEELATRMVAKGHEVTCYNRSGHHISGVEFDDKTTGKVYKGVRIKKVFTVKKKGLAAVTSSFFGTLYATLGKYDIIHIHAEGPAVFCWIPKLFREKVVVTVHGLDWQREKWKGSFGSRYIYLGEKMAVKWADEIIVLSKEQQSYFLEKYGRKTVFIPNGVNQPSIIEAYEIKKKFALEKGNYILFLGRIVPEKGVHYLIKAWYNVESDKKLVIAGGSSDSDEYMIYLKELAKSDNRIIFTGFVQERLLEELYSNCYLYVLPSDLEGMPLSLLEAMSYGNCCIVSDIYECSSVIGDMGIVFDKGNIDDLEEKLQKCIDDTYIVDKYRNISAKYINQKYNWNRIVNKTIGLYKKCIH